MTFRVNVLPLFQAAHLAAISPCNSTNLDDFAGKLGDVLASHPGHIKPVIVKVGEGLSPAEIARILAMPVANTATAQQLARNAANNIVQRGRVGQFQAALLGLPSDRFNIQEVRDHIRTDLDLQRVYGAQLFAQSSVSHVVEDHLGTAIQTFIHERLQGTPLLQKSLLLALGTIASVQAGLPTALGFFQAQGGVGAVTRVAPGLLPLLPKLIPYLTNPESLIAHPEHAGALFTELQSVVSRPEIQAALPQLVEEFVRFSTGAGDELHAAVGGGLPEMAKVADAFLCIVAGNDPGQKIQAMAYIENKGWDFLKDPAHADVMVRLMTVLIGTPVSDPQTLQQQIDALVTQTALDALQSEAATTFLQGAFGVLARGPVSFENIFSAALSVFIRIKK